MGSSEHNWQYLITDWWQNAKFRHGGIFHPVLYKYYNQMRDFTNQIYVKSSLSYCICFLAIETIDANLNVVKNKHSCHLRNRLIPLNT